MKTVVMIDGVLEGVEARTRIPPSNITNNQWVQNVRRNKPGPSKRRNRWRGNGAHHMEGDRQGQRFHKPNHNSYVWRRATPPMTHVAQESNPAVKKPIDKFAGRFRQKMRYPEYQPLDSN